MMRPATVSCLLLLCALLSGCEEDDRLRARVTSLKQRQAALQSQLAEVDAGRERWQTQVDEATRRQDRGGELKARLNVATAALAEAEKATAAHRATIESCATAEQEHARRVRESSIGRREKLLVLTDGRRLTEVEVARVRPSSLDLKHSEGTITVRKADLPPEWQDRYRLTVSTAPDVDFEWVAGRPAIEIEALFPDARPTTPQNIARYREIIAKVRRQILGAKYFIDQMDTRMAAARNIRMQQPDANSRLDTLAATAGIEQIIADTRSRIKIAESAARELEEQLDKTESRK